jgi:hypothetical protein
VELGIEIAAGPMSRSDRHDPGADAPRSIVDAYRADRLGVIEALRHVGSGAAGTVALRDRTIFAPETFLPIGRSGRRTGP